ncbi:MAG TPA: hypothetical protein VFC50_00925 [Candidatus Dormibacteraeota bacterium]|nr:hypothetical protein [Candidatus Dormibacteraeota bacterium]
MIHPAFQEVPDQYIAEAFSETLLPGYCKFTASPHSVYDLDKQGYPPVPSHLVGLTAAFIDRDGVTVRRLGAYNFSPEHTPEREELVKAYESTVGGLQERFPGLELDAMAMGFEVSQPEYGALGSWCIEATQRDNKRLLAAHLISVTADRGEVVDALVYPAVVYRELPLAFRNAVEPLALGQIPGMEAILSEEDREALRRELDPIMKLDKSLQDPVAVAVAGLLPPAANFPRILDIYLGQ